MFFLCSAVKVINKELSLQFNFLFRIIMRCHCLRDAHNGSVLSIFCLFLFNFQTIVAMNVVTEDIMPAIAAAMVVAPVNGK